MSKGAFFRCGCALIDGEIAWVPTCAKHAPPEEYRDDNTAGHTAGALQGRHHRANTAASHVADELTRRPVINPPGPPMAGDLRNRPGLHTTEYFDGETWHEVERDVSSLLQEHRDRRQIELTLYREQKLARGSVLALAPGEAMSYEAQVRALLHHHDFAHLVDTHPTEVELLLSWFRTRSKEETPS